MSASLDETDVRHVAHLARLTLTDEERTRYAAQLSTVLAYVRRLNELDTDDVEPLAHPLDMTDVSREDTRGISWDPQRALRNAPEHKDGFFKVPKVLDQGEA